jgi:hypothetical protein
VLVDHGRITDIDFAQFLAVCSTANSQS